MMMVVIMMMMMRLTVMLLKNFSMITIRISLYDIEYKVTEESKRFENII